MPPLRRNQRNEVFEIVQRSALSPAEFSWDTVGQSSRITHISTGEKFVFGPQVRSDGSLLTAYLNTISRLAAPRWRTALKHFESWLTDLAEELTTPDAWASLDSGAEQTFWNAASEGGGDNTPFSPEERERIASQLALLRAGVRDRYALDEAQLRMLDAKLDELIDASRRLGRKDWMAIFLGVMLTLVVTSVLTPDVMQQLIEEFARGVAHMFSLPPGLPPVE